MKQTMRCPKCQHNRLLHIPSAMTSGKYAPEALGSLAERHSLAGTVLGLPIGSIEAAICRNCGYMELYAKDPGSIPIDGQYVREVVGPESPPYR